MLFKAYVNRMPYMAFIAIMLYLAYYWSMSYLLQTPDQLAVHLRALRLAKGCSQKQLAEKLGLSQSRIARIERDPLSISVDQLLKVLGVLGASMGIHLDASRTDLMRMPASPEIATGATGPAPAPTADKLAAKSEQGDW